MSVARVVAVAPGSPAAAAGIAPGDELLAVNGEVIRDVIRYQLQTDEARVELDVRRGGLESTFTIRKAAGAGLGLELDTAVFDRVRTCDNHCPFCFIHQLPPGMRASLSLKDDDYRLSFLYGNFTTLTRFTEADYERVVTEHLSPLYVSIHATDPELRARLLRNRRGGTSLRWLRALLDADIEIHGQIVCCPGLNDGEALDETLLGIFDRFGDIASVGVVPLGVSAHNREPEMRPHTRAEAIDVLERVERWQTRFAALRASRVVWAADEYYLLAGRPFPALGEYEGCAQHENGIGMAATFGAEIEAAVNGRALIPRTEAHSGFFAWVDGARPDGYRVAESTARSPRDETGQSAFGGDRAELPVTIVTGALGAEVIEPHLAALRSVAPRGVDVLAVPNEWFGGNIAVTGLLTGSDLAAALRSAPAEGRYLVPDVTLSKGRFLDGLTPADLPRPVEVVPTSGVALVEAVRCTPATQVLGRP